MYDSLSLLDLHEEFENVFSGKLRVVNFFEQRKTRILKLWFLQWEEWVSRPLPTKGNTLKVDAVRSGAISEVQ